MMKLSVMKRQYKLLHCIILLRQFKMCFSRCCFDEKIKLSLKDEKNPLKITGNGDFYAAIIMHVTKLNGIKCTADTFQKFWSQ